MIYSMLDDINEVKRKRIARFWDFLNRTESGIVNVNDTDFIVIDSRNIHAFCDEYRDDDFLNLKMLDGTVYAEIEQLCVPAKIGEIFKGVNGDENNQSCGNGACNIQR